MTDEVLEKILAHTPDAVALIDAEGQVLHWNRAAVTLFGYAADEVSGRKLGELIASDEHLDLYKQLLQRAEEGDLCTDEAVRRRKDGSNLHVSGSTKAIRDASGALTHFLLTMKDVTA